MINETLNKALNCLIVEVGFEITNDIRDKIQDNIREAVNRQTARERQEVLRVSRHRNAVFDANEIMRDALERIFRGTGTTFGDGAQKSAGVFQGIAERALARANGKEVEMKEAAQPCGGYYCSEEHGHIDCSQEKERLVSDARTQHEPNKTT